MPTRVQMTRSRPWRHEHPDAVIVARPTKWGNPLTMAAYRAIERELAIPPASDTEVRAELTQAFRSLVVHGPDSGYWSPANYRAVLTICDGLDAGEIHGRDLACWCPLDSPCHGDVLLELANGEV